MNPSNLTYEALLCTGHHLEWISLAPPEFCPTEAAIERAAGFITATLPTHSYGTITASYAPFSHAARSVALLKLVDAAAYSCAEGF